MRYLIFLTYITALLMGNESKVCQQCHPQIFKEYYNSPHRLASVINNPIHKAAWEREEGKDRGYSCAKCHSPSDKKALDEGILEAESFVQKEEPISCVYCHSITSIQEHEKANETHLSGKKREFYSLSREREADGKIDYTIKSSFFGLFSSNSGSPYHKIDYTNRGFYNGKVCMGCHSHNVNAHGIDTFMLDAAIDESDKQSCISCHMPQIDGSKVTIHKSKTHAYHGISGITNRTLDLGQYIDIKLHVKKESFRLTLLNRANHALFGGPYREGILEVIHKSGTKTFKLKPYIFERVIKENEVLKDSLIYAKKEIVYKNKLHKGDILDINLYVKSISSQGLKALALEDKLSEKKLLKTVRIVVP